MTAVSGRGAAGCVLGLALLSGGCTEDILTGVDPDTAPGDAAETIELELSATDLPVWLDTTFLGYALPSTSGILVVSESADLRSRVLARFPTLPSSVFVDSTQVDIESFDAARLRVVLDTAASTVADSGLDLSLYALARGFDEREASWSEAAAGVPWTTPGGDLGALLGTLHMDSLATDTVFVPFSVDTDSVLTAWRAAGGEPGVALVAESGGATLTVEQLALGFDVKPVGLDTLIAALRSPSPQTFIFDPETPPPAGRLRIGGLPAARIYLRFELPDSVAGVRLRGAIINRATLVFTSLGPPPAPFATSDTLGASTSRLLADPFEFGPKTPIGAQFPGVAPLAPEDLGAGDELSLSVTTLVQTWAASDPASAPDLRAGIAIAPEGAGLAFWEFGSVQDTARAPKLRLLLTPPTAFDLP